MDRLSLKKDFERVLERPTAARGASLVCKTRERGEGPARLGIVVSRRVSKKAVERNRLRRIIKEELRRLEPKEGVDAVLIVLPRAEGAEAGELRAQLRDVLAQADLL